MHDIETWILQLVTEVYLSMGWPGVVGGDGRRLWVSGKPSDKYGKYVLITHEELDRAEAWFDKYGEWAVFFSRMVPVLRT